MNVIHSKAEPTAISPEVAHKLLMALFSKTQDPETKKEISRLVYDYAPSQRDESWALKVSALVDSAKRLAHQ